MSVAASSQRLESESPSVSPPQSAQPYQSIFGGEPSSQNVDQEPYTQPDPGGDGISQGEENENLLEYDEEPLLPIPDDDSDDPTYDEGDDGDDGFSGPDAKGRRKGKEAILRDDNLVQLPPSSPPQYRQNRYQGPGSTWRKWTEQERQIADGLEEMRARDLSAHLFNAFALKRRARELKEKALEDGEYWEEIAGVRVSTAPFVPPKIWTAWPMPASEVPRADERALIDEDEAWTLKGPPDPRPSADLEESLMAIMMKTAKERFLQREWAPKERRRKQSAQEDDGESTGDDAEWKTEQGLSDGIERRPVVQADDDVSRQQLRPLVRNIITRFDRLLMGLHHARKASIAPDDSSTTESDTDTESALSAPSHSSSTRKRRLTSTSERSRSRGRKRVRTTSPAESALVESSDAHCIEESEDNPSEMESMSSSASSSASPPPPPRARRSRSIRRSRSRTRDPKAVARLGLRDWSDVLGIASMIDCPQSAVMRAAKRCADLFGEDMIFRTLEEGRVQQVQSTTNGDTVSEWRYIEDPDQEKEDQEAQRKPSVSRSRSRPHSRRSSTSRKREASVATDVIVAKEEDSGPGAAAAAAPPRRHKGKGKGKHRKEDILCPVVGCRRHTDGFTRTWNLTLHMRRVHPGYVRGEQAADAPVEQDQGMHDVEEE